MALPPFLARRRADPPIPSPSTRLRTGLWQDERGVTMIELGLILALISLACIIAFTSLGLSLTGVFTTATNAMAG